MIIRKAWARDGCPKFTGFLDLCQFVCFKPNKALSFKSEIIFFKFVSFLLEFEFLPSDDPSEARR